VDPVSAISTHIQSIGPTIVINSITNDLNLGQVATIGQPTDACLVFVNADSGEGYITVDGNVGDGTNITLWHGGEALIAAAALRASLKEFLPALNALNPCVLLNSIPSFIPIVSVYRRSMQLIIPSR
jgi:predicted heme/steroid binding protein